MLILAGCLPFTGLAAFISWWFLLGAFAAACAYYTIYEFLHWCMHKPRHKACRRTFVTALAKVRKVQPT